MSTWELVIRIYLIVGGIVAIPLARMYWKSFRDSKHPSNTVLAKVGKLDLNRIVDSFVFLIAWMVITLLYPLYLLEMLYNDLLKNGKGYKHK